MNSLEHRIPPPIVAAVIAAAMWATARHTPHVALPDALRLIAAGSLFVVGLLFGGLGVLAFRRARTTIDPVHIESASALVTTGIFRMTRNPMYVGFAFLLSAWAVYSAAPLALIGIAAFTVLTWRFQIVPEERAMLAKFGTAYADYQRKTPRWL